MSDSKIKIILFSVAIIVAIIWLLSPDKDFEDKKVFFSKLNLNLTGIVTKVIPTKEHDYGVIFLKNIKTNKGDGYIAEFKEKYLFCKTSNGESIIVTSLISEIAAGDSIVINTNHSKYLAYKRSGEIAQINLSLNDEDFFYTSLNIRGYFDFNYYHNK
jgi:hypothetical protein